MKVWESMAKKKRSQSKASKGQRRAVIRGRAHTDQEVFTEIAKAWRPLLRGVRWANAEKRLFEITIGTLLAAKLMLRLANEGKLHFKGDPVVWERLEQISDDLAETHFETIASGLPWPEAAGIRLKAEREYLHLMRDRTVFRWCKTDIRNDETLPVEPERLEGTYGPSLETAYRILEPLGNWRAATAADREQAMFEMIAQIVGIMGASKLLLAMWGNGKIAATLERLAEMASEREYDPMSANESS